MSAKKTAFKYTALAAFILAVSAFAMWFGIFVSENDIAQELISRYGYMGAFALGVVSGFNLIVPIPAAAFVPSFKAAGENVFFATSAITIGMTIGDLVGYLIGKTGRAVVFSENHRNKISHLISYLEKIKERHHNAPLFLLFLTAAFSPIPNEVFVVPMAFLGYKLKYVFPVVLAGNAIFNLIASLLFLGIFEGVR